MHEQRKHKRLQGRPASTQDGVSAFTKALYHRHVHDCAVFNSTP